MQINELLTSSIAFLHFDNIGVSSVAGMMKAYGQAIKEFRKNILSDTIQQSTEHFDISANLIV